MEAAGSSGEDTLAEDLQSDDSLRHTPALHKLLQLAATGRDTSAYFAILVEVHLLAAAIDSLPAVETGNILPCR